jgi:hypothetical protein
MLEQIRDQTNRETIRRMEEAKKNQTQQQQQQPQQEQEPRQEQGQEPQQQQQQQPKQEQEPQQEQEQQPLQLQQLEPLQLPSGVEGDQGKGKKGIIEEKAGKKEAVKEMIVNQDVEIDVVQVEYDSYVR